MEYTCRIAGERLFCTITADRDLAAPVFCFSGMAPLSPVSGGRLVRSLGSYTEVALPDLTAGEAHEVEIAYAGGHRPANRAWMPLGPYLRVGDEVIVLPPTEAGRRAEALPDLGPFDGLSLVPQPVVWAPAGGHLEADGFACDDDALGAVADLANRQGMRFRGDAPVRVAAADMAEDAYALEIGPDGIAVEAGGYGGRFYAGITLLTLLQRGALPLGRIEDAPRFGWRGQHLDTARHFYRPETICALLDLMALLKLNRFHWHFADDEAFRIEIESHPALWQKTAMRGEGHLLPGLFSGRVEDGGTYSRETVAAIVAHGRRLNIEILPEIEAPAHALAIARVYPETLDPEDEGTERSVQGYAGNVLNPAMEKTWEVLGDVATEVGAMFPFGHLHLGCDELPEDTWMGSAKARTLMAEHGLETTEDLQGWTIAKLAGIVAANGQRPCAWEEAARGSQSGIGHDAILFSWTGQGPGLAAARAGYDVVMTPAQHVYLDMAHTDDPDDWGASWAAFVSLEDTVAWNPVPEPDLADRIIGVQGAFWSEFTTMDAEMWPMLMPRMLGVAAMAWQEVTPAPDDLTRLARGYSVTSSGIEITAFIGK